MKRIKIVAPPEVDPFRHGPRFHHHHTRTGAVLFHDRDLHNVFSVRDDFEDGRSQFTHLDASRHYQDHENLGAVTPCRRRACPWAVLDGESR